jgi:PAS domain S-box-containing protein
MSLLSTIHSNQSQPQSPSASAAGISLGGKVISAAIANSINAIAITDLNGKHMYVNRSWEKMWGYSRKEAIEMMIPHMVAEEELPKLKKEILPAIMEKGGYVGESVGLRKNKSKFSISFSASLIRDAKGKPVGTMASFIDITELKKKEEKIIQFANTTRKHLRTIIPILQKIAMGDFSESIKIPEKEDEFTELFVALNLMIDDLKESNVELKKNSQNLKNSITATQNILHDFRIEKESLAYANAKYGALLESIGDGIIAVDTDGIITFMNRVAEDMLGWKLQEAIGKKL